MRGSWALVLAIALLVSLGCGGESATPDPRVRQLEESANTMADAVNDLVNEVGQLKAAISATPTPAPTPGPTLEDIAKAFDDSIAEAVAAIPTPLPRPTEEDVLGMVQEGIRAYDEARPTPTPGPTMAQIEGLISGEVTQAVSLLPPVPTPGPSLQEVRATVAQAVSALPTTIVLPNTSASSRNALSGDLSLTVDPGKPIAGRDVRFTLEGVEPWTRIEVEFIDPRNQPAEWVTDDEIHFSRDNGQPVTRQVMFADESGSVAWQRIGTKDVEGVWTVRLDVGGRASSVTYPVSQLQLPFQNVETVGLEMRRYQGLLSDTYQPSLVPTSLAIDLQAHLRWVVGRLQETLGLHSRRLPDIYLLGDQRNLETVSEAIGREVGFEYGIYRSSGERPGIFMQTDSYRTGVQRVLTHEYVHLLVDELANERSVPAWLNEGLAQYLESKLGLESERPDVTRRITYGKRDMVRDASASGAGLALPSLESQEVWNAQTDRNMIDLQYATALMAVTCISRDFSEQAPVEIVRWIGAGSSLPQAIQNVLGMTYKDFQTYFDVWAEQWKDDTREEARRYAEQMSALYDRIEEQAGRREATLDNSVSHSQRVTVLRDVVAQLGNVREELQAMAPLQSRQPFHDEFRAYLGAVTDWLSLGRDYSITGEEAKRTAANDMIPEVNARNTLVWSSLNNLQYVYQVGRY